MIMSIYLPSMHHPSTIEVSYFYLFMWKNYINKYECFHNHLCYWLAEKQTTVCRIKNIWCMSRCWTAQEHCRGLHSYCFPSQTSSTTRSAVIPRNIWRCLVVVQGISVTKRLNTVNCVCWFLTLVSVQPQFQKWWDAVKNVNKSRMQWFANLINPYFIPNRA